MAWGLQGQVTLEYAFGETVGIETGYGGVRFLHVPALNSKNLYYINADVFLLDRGDAAASLGVGKRAEVGGAYLFYDYREGFHQISGGGEVAWGLHFLRAHAYLPVGNNTRYFEECHFSYEGGYEGSYQVVERAFRWVEAEYERLFPFTRHVALHACVEPYYFIDCQAPGIRLEAGAHIAFVKVEGAFSYDRLFDKKWQGIIKVELPLRGKIRPVHRRPMIASGRFCVWDWNWVDV